MITATKYESVKEMVARLVSDHVGADVIAPLIMEEVRGTPPCDCHGCHIAEEMIYHAVSKVLGSYRRHEPPDLPPSDLPAEPFVESSVETDEDGEVVFPPEVWASSRQRHISKAATDPKYLAYLHDRQYVSTVGDWVSLGDLTAPLCRLNAERRRDQAAGFLSTAAKLESLANSLEAFRVDRVAQLPQSVVLDIMKGKAA